MSEDHSDNSFNCPFQKDFGAYETSIANIESGIDEIRQLLKTQNGRTDKLESWRDKLIGGWVLVVLILVPLFIRMIEQWVKS